jgi:hypothetical protein
MPDYPITHVEITTRGQQVPKLIIYLGHPCERLTAKQPPALEENTVVSGPALNIMYYLYYSS